MDNLEIAGRVEKLVEALREEAEWLRAHGAPDIAALFGQWASELEAIARRLRALAAEEQEGRECE